MTGQSLNILDRIHDLYYHLTATEQRVADYVLNNSAEVQFMSITQLADECGTADATVSRFCKKLQLKGFNAFKIELAKHTALQKGRSVSHPEEGSLKSRCQAAVHDAKKALEQTMELVDPDAVAQAVTCFEQAAHIICLGSGASAILATEMAHLFSGVSLKFRAVMDSHQQTVAVVSLNPGDAVVLFSYSGATTDGQQLLQLARSRGVKTILITRYSKSPAARMADLVLRCGSNEGPLQGGSVPARMAQLVLMDMLFREFYHRNQEACDEKMRLAASSLSSKHI